MTTAHDEFLELAAAAIDFELSRDERAALERHLADCSACRHRVAGFAADQTAIARLPRYVIGPAAATAVRGRVTRRSSAPRPTLRIAGRGRHARTARARSPGRGRPDEIRRDHDLTEVMPDDRTQPGRTGPAAGRPGRRIDRRCHRLEDLGCAPHRPWTIRSRPSSNRSSVVASSSRSSKDPSTRTTTTGTWSRRSAGPIAAGSPRPITTASPGSRIGAPASAKPATFTAVEASLVSALRTDAAIGCAPRRVDLPGALDGRRCRVNGAVVTRVGAYHFGDARDAATTYLERLASSDVKPATGDCPGGKSGDAAWMAGDRKAGKDGPRLRRRHGSMGRRSDRLLSRRERDRQRPADLRRDVRRILGRDADSRTSIATRWPPRPARRRLARCLGSAAPRPIDGSMRLQRGCELSASSQRILTRGRHRHSTAAQARGTHPMDRHHAGASRRHRRSGRRPSRAASWPTRPRTSRPGPGL